MQYNITKRFAEVCRRVGVGLIFVLLSSCSKYSIESLTPLFYCSSTNLLSSGMFDDLMCCLVDSTYNVNSIYYNADSSIVIYSDDTIPFTYGDDDIEEESYADTVETGDTMLTRSEGSDDVDSDTVSNDPSYLAFSGCLDSIGGDFNVLYVGMDTLRLTPELQEIMAGRNVSILADEHIEDFNIVGEGYKIDKFVEVLKGNDTTVSLIKIPGSAYSFKLPSALCTRHFPKNITGAICHTVFGQNSESEVVATCNGNPVAVTVKLEDNQQITLMTVPLAFTNYALSYDSCNALAMIDLMKVCGLRDTSDRCMLLPFHRVISENSYYDDFYMLAKDVKMSTSQKNALKESVPSIAEYVFKTILQYLLPLILVLLLPLCIRRRQQIIPIVKAPANRTAAFVKQISKLYLQNKEYDLILHKRIIYFFNEVNERFHIQLNDEQNLKANAAFLSAMTGRNEDELEQFIRRMHTWLKDENITKQQLKNYIDQINDLAADIKNTKI